MITVEQAASEAVGRWLSNTAKSGQNCLRTHLPALDFDHLFKVMHRNWEHDNPASFAFCAANFDVDEPTLRQKTERAGLKFATIADHLQQAADWRNRSDYTIIALARGEPEGGNTLQEFTSASSEDLARGLLEWLADPEHPFSDARVTPELHGRLLSVLSKHAPPGIVLSLDGVCRFTAAWSAARESTEPQERNDAPLFALAELGLAWDGELLNTQGDAEESLPNNLNRALIGTQEILGLSEKELEKLKIKATSFDPPSRRPMLSALISAIQDAQRGATPERLRKIRLDHWRILQQKRAGAAPVARQASFDWAAVEGAIVNKLLDKHEDDCVALFDAIAAIDVVDRFRELSWDFGNGIESLELESLRPEGEALLSLTDAEKWGAVAQFSREQPTQALLKQLQASRLKEMRPEIVVLEDDQTGQTYNLPQLLDTWSRFDISELSGTSLTDLWLKWKNSRSTLLSLQEWLLMSPLVTLAGNLAARNAALDLLDASSKLLANVSRASQKMTEVWRAGAEALFQTLLALDVVQIRVLGARPSQAGNRCILLPTHPLQLWRNLTFVLKCIDAPSDVSDNTRRAIYKSISRTDLYLPAWFASRFPNQEGAGKLLPFAGVLGGLPVFQNLDNAVASIDGAEDVAQALVRFSAIYPEFCRPLRVTVINPPDPERLLPALASCLDAPKGPERLELRFVATGRLRSRLAEAQRLYLAAGGDLGDAINSGQLTLELGQIAASGVQGQNLEELILDLEKTPAHILIIFDEAGVELQRRSLGRSLPMSPFAVTCELRKTGPPHAPRLTLEPTFSEDLFTGASRLISAVESTHGDSLSANVDAAGYVAAIDKALQSNSPSALWTIVADRSLPGDARLKSCRLMRVHREVREVGIFCGDLMWLARRVKAAFSECNLDLRETDMVNLLREGASLLAGGLLELVQVRDGKPNNSLVQGMAGSLFAARAWHKAHPEGLLFSVDSPVARAWLGLGENSVRSDLIGLYDVEGCLHFDIIEVKTSHEPVALNRIDEAVTQVVTTLKSIEHGLTGTDVLATPRQEMLKEVLKHAIDVMPFILETQERSEHQKQWIDWVLDLFATENRRNFTVNGRVICVHLRDPNPPPVTVRDVEGKQVRIEVLGQEQCLALGLNLPSDITSRGPQAEEEHRNAGSGSETPSAIGSPRSSPSASGISGPTPQVTPTATGTNEPSVLIGEKPSGEPVIWKPIVNGRPVYNPHLVIVGGSGSGKTETIKSFLWELHRSGVGCLVFDFKDDYVQPEFAQKLGATVHLAEDGLPLNPMIPGVDPLTGRSDIVSHVFAVEGTLSKIYGLGEQQSASLRAAMFTLYERNGFPRTPTVLDPHLVPPAFVDIRKELLDNGAETLASRLSPIFDLNLFRAESPNLRELFVGAHVVRFTRMPNEEVKKACAEILLLGCYNEILRLGHSRELRLALVIDEAHRIADLHALKLLLRESRAYGVSVCLSSQQARDFSDEIYGNADTLIGLKVNEIRDAERLGALLAGTSGARELANQIRRMQPGEGFLKNNDYQPYVKLHIRPLSQRT